MTLRLSLPGYALSAPRADGRVELSVPGFQVTGTPGRPLLPYAQTLVALPPGGGATACGCSTRAPRRRGRACGSRWAART